MYLLQIKSSNASSTRENSALLSGMRAIYEMSKKLASKSKNEQNEMLSSSILSNLSLSRETFVARHHVARGVAQTQVVIHRQRSKTQVSSAVPPKCSETRIRRWLALTAASISGLYRIGNAFFLSVFVILPSYDLIN